jgi:hypothetical protein
MKTLKKVFPFILLVSFLCGGILSSCKDSDNEAKPKINYILPSAAAQKDSIIVGANAEEHIIIVGENFSSVVQVYFDDILVDDLNPVYVTDNYIILKLPEVLATTREVILVTRNGVRVAKAFEIKVPAPTIEMFYSEFVPAGDMLRIRGNYFIGPRVFFHDENGNEIEALEVDVKSTRVLHARVPENVAHTTRVTVQNGSGKTQSRIFFRDRRNIIIDFDEFKATQGGTMCQYTELDADGRGTWRKNTDPGVDFDVEALLPEGFVLPKGCDGIYNQINSTRWNPGAHFLYMVELGGRDIQKPLVGDFADVDAANLVLKFEVYVPREYPINGVFFDIVFPPKGFNNFDGVGGKEITKTEIPGSWWVPFEANTETDVDSGDVTWLIGSKAKETFFTDGWMTVSVPLRTFLWNCHYGNVGSGLRYGEYPLLSDVATWGIYSENMVLETDWNKAMGDFSFYLNQWALSGGDFQASGSFLSFFDNFRIVPEDGGGAEFSPRLGTRIRRF